MNTETLKGMVSMTEMTLKKEMTQAMISGCVKPLSVFTCSEPIVAESWLIAFPSLAK
jgi:hypothetical protein